MNTELKLPYIADTLSVAVLRTILSEETIFSNSCYLFLLL